MSQKKPAKAKLMINLRAQNQLVLVVLVLVVTVAGVMAISKAMASSVPSLSSWNVDLARTIHADNTQSVTLPDGRTLWAFGDTTAVNGKSTVGKDGYPHDAFVLQDASSMSFHAVAGPFGYDWQQVPNWSDGTYFWMSTPVVYHGTLYVLGSRVKGAANFKVVGQYVAEFNATTLKYERIVAVPSGPGRQTVWGGVAVAKGGWWVSGTHSVTCSFETDCKAGDMSWVPSGQLANGTRWKVYPNVIPAGTNIGTVVALLPGNKIWNAYSKTGDAYGGTTIERLTASSVAGKWTVVGSYAAPSPAGTITYSVAVHPEQEAPNGDVLASYNVNDVSTDYHAHFIYLPK